jgi:phosphate transport system permease protein
MGMTDPGVRRTSTASGGLIAGGLAAWLCGIAAVTLVFAMLVSLVLAGRQDISSALGTGSDVSIGDVLFWSVLVVGIALPLAATFAFFAGVAGAERPIGRIAGSALNASLRVAPAVPSVAIGVAALAILTSNASVEAWARSNAIAAASIALAALNVPIMSARFRAAFRAVPRSWRVAAAAVGAGPSVAFWGVVAPRSAPAILGVLLNSAGQMFGETAVLAIVLGLENGVRVVNGAQTVALVPLSVHLWQDLTIGLPAASSAPASAAEALILVAAIVSMRFVARVLSRRRKVGAPA